MSRKLPARLLATALALAVSPLPLITAAPPAKAQVALTVSFGYFHGALSPYGRWFHHPHWGDVWLPAVAGFRPYHRHGHWAYTDAGWVWVSDYRWGDIAFHYGRWVYDPGNGWLWIPGYVWAPAWVVWYEGDGYVGWCPTPPDNAFLAGEEIYPVVAFDYDRAFGYLDWYGPAYGRNWLASSAFVFVPESHFADANFTRYAVDPPQAERIIGRTRNVTNFATIGDRVVNRSIDPNAIARASGRHFAPVPVGNALRTNARIDPVSAGRRIQAAENPRHGGDPHAPVNARAMPLNAAAAARGGRATFGGQRAARAATPQTHAVAQMHATRAAGPARITHAGHAPVRMAMHAARAPMRAALHGTHAAHGPARLAARTSREHGFAAPHGALAGRVHEMHFAGHAAFAPRVHVAHMAPRAGRARPHAMAGPPRLAFGGAPPARAFGGGPHGGFGGGPPAGFGGGGGPRGGFGGGPPAGFGGGGGPHGGGGKHGRG